MLVDDKNNFTNIIFEKIKFFKFKNNVHSFETQNLYELDKNLNFLKNLKIQNFKKKSEKKLKEIEIVLAKLKIELITKKNLYVKLSNVLGKNIENFSQLENIEFDENEKQESIKNLLKKDRNYFIDLIYQYINLKPAAYEKVLSLDENVIKNIKDDDIHLNEEKITKDANNSKNNFPKKSKEMNLIDQINYLKNKLHISTFQLGNEKQRKLIYKTYLEEIKSILEKMKKKSKKSYLFKMKNIIINQNFYLDKEKNSNKIIKFSERLIYHK